MIAMRNTCAFDSIAQSMLAAYHDFSTYNRTIVNSKIAINKFIETLSKSGACSKTYNERCEILKNTSIVKNGVLNCETNVATLLELHILNTPSLEIQINCNGCRYKKISSISVLDIIPDAIFKDAMRGLQQAINQTTEYYVSKNQSCHICKGTRVTTAVVGGSHIFLNLETVEIELIAARRGFANCRKKFTLSEIPENLNYCGRHYRIISVIVFDSGHYYACTFMHLTQPSGTWEEHNDLSSSRKVRKISNREVLKQRRTLLLFYVQI